VTCRSSTSKPEFFFPELAAGGQISEKIAVAKRKAEVGV
jgi:hypothetical protein